MSSNILHISPEVIAAWPTPNYDYPDRMTWMPIYSSIWFAAATVMVAMRYWLRARGHAGRLGLDDVSNRLETELMDPTVADGLQGNPVPRLACRTDVHNCDDDVHRTSSRRPPYLGRRARNAPVCSALYVDGPAFIFDLWRMHKSVYSLFLSSVGRRNVQQALDVARMDCDRLYHRVHDRVLHHAPRQLLAD